MDTPCDPPPAAAHPTRIRLCHTLTHAPSLVVLFLPSERQSTSRENAARCPLVSIREHGRASTFRTSRGEPTKPEGQRRTLVDMRKGFGRCTRRKANLCPDRQFLSALQDKKLITSSVAPSAKLDQRPPRRGKFGLLSDANAPGGHHDRQRSIRVGALSDNYVPYWAICPSRHLVAARCLRA